MTKKNATFLEDEEQDKAPEKSTQIQYEEELYLSKVLKSCGVSERQSEIMAGDHCLMAKVMESNDQFEHGPKDNHTEVSCYN